jgi:hypothetical protein
MKKNFLLWSKVKFVLKINYKNPVPVFMWENRCNCVGNR